MSLRFKTLISNSALLHRKALFFILITFCSFLTIAQNGSDDVKKEAAKRFEEEDYVASYKLYSQLVANYPKDPEYNFRLGVSMIFAEPDKKKCLPYLQLANSNPESPKESKFYLGKAYHINYLFDEALKYYNEYKKIGSSSQIKKLQVDREIKACVFGKRLLSNLSDLVIQNKKQLNEGDYFRSYDLRDIGGKLLVKPEEFKTSADKKKKDKSVVYLPPNGEKVYFSSYGESDNRDIYYATKLPNGTFSKPQKVNGINSEYDEDYPFLHPNGQTLYFASKGHNGMGGYDIFKSSYIEATNSWSQPVNLEFPINSPDDDFLYVTDSLEKTAYFSTGRQSLPGKIDVLKISTERKPIDVLAIKGTVVKENADQSLKSKITVKNMDNGDIVGIFDAGDNGDYLMDLPNGAKLLYTVETPGLKTQSDRVSLPLAATSKPLRQTISYDKGILKIINYFDEAATDDSYLQYLKIIEKKAKLDVNEGQNKLGPTILKEVAGDPKLNKGTGNTNNSDGPKVEDGNSNSVTSNTTSAPGEKLDNKKLSDLARKDAAEINKEAIQLKDDSRDAYELANKKKEEGAEKIKEAEKELADASQITDPTKKKDAVAKAIDKKKDGENDENTSKKLLLYADALKEDAAVKSKEAELNIKYADELDKTTNPKNNNTESLAKLDFLQKQIDELSSKKKKSDEVFNSIKSEAEEKEKQISILEKNHENNKANVQEIKEAISSLETDLEKAKKKKDKEAIKEKIDELTADLVDKNTQLSKSGDEIDQAKNDLAGLTKGVDLANKVKSEDIVQPSSSLTAATNTNVSGDNTNSQKTTSEVLKDKYKDKISGTDFNDQNSISKNTNELKNFNKEIDAAITKNKNELAKATNSSKKQQLTSDTKLLEDLKKQNQQQIAENTKKLDELNKSVTNNTTASNNSTNSNSGARELNSVNASSKNDAVDKLNQLNNKLDNYDNSSFDYNGYQNPQAQAQKVEADAKINEAITQQKKLKETINQTKEKINKQADNKTLDSGNPEQLHKEAEELSTKAFDLRTEAKTKTGKEKDDLIAKAKELETQSNEKNLEAAVVIASDNNSIYNTNNDNIKLLSANKKASEDDLSEAKKLNEEANVLFKQATSIRDEANSIGNAGAKLGNLNNAEEKEAEAIAKQLEAIKLLKSSNPDVVLKSAATSSNNPGTNNSANFSNELNSVNQGIESLLNKKSDAYQKLYEANDTEIGQLYENINKNRSTIEKTPALKSEMIAIDNKLKSIQKAKQDSENETDNNKKIELLTQNTKKQIELINQLSAFEKGNNSTLSSANSSNNNENNSSNSGSNNGVANNSTSNTNENNSGTSNPTNSGNNSNNSSTSANTNSSSSTNTTSPSASNSVTSSDSDSNNTNANNRTTEPTVNNTGKNNTIGNPKDTTVGQIINLFNNTNSQSLSNPQAGNMVAKSLDDLKKTESELKIIEQKLAGGSNGNSTAPNVLKSNAENLIQESDELSVKAFDLRTEAKNKQGAEKEELINKAKDLENQSQNKKLEAIKLTETANNTIYGTNSNAISELLEKAKKDDPTMASQLSEKINETNNLKSQSAQLRNEASGLTNNSAKIGSYMNAEEKEIEMLQLQNEILLALKNKYPNYVIKEKESVSQESVADLQLKKNLLKEKQYNSMTELTNAFSLEYETSKKNVPEQLNAEQKDIKEKADAANAESKRLLIQSAGEKNENEKSKLISLAAKNGKEAVEILKTISPQKAITNTNGNSGNNNVAVNNNGNSGNNNAGNSANRNNQNSSNSSNNSGNSANNNSGNSANSNNSNNSGNSANTTGRTNNPNNTGGNNTTDPVSGTGTIKIDGLEVVRGNAYSEAKPIPVDEPIPNGLIFRVQIGAFKNKIPNNAFRGLSPLNGETTSNGYIRYTAGNFQKFENANAVKNDLRNLGYSDAFVVVFFNGKRIPLNEALDILAKEGKTVVDNASQTAGITANANVPKATVNVGNPDLNTQDAVNVTRELETTNGLLFTVQIGVYNKQVSKQRLLNLRPVYTEKLPSGLYRYTAGIYNNPDKLITDKNRVIGLGIRDAFVSAYLNGKRITFAEGKEKQNTAGTIMEPENPIIFPESSASNSGTTGNQTNTNPVNPPAVTSGNNGVQPFSNGVTSYPAPTAENGVKLTEEGICFKVQIGAYSKQVPAEVAARFSSIRSWPVENKSINNLYIYNIGNFSGLQFAKNLKEEAVRAGITDAFVSVYKDGKKLSPAEASPYLNPQ